ncbi:MAG: InlB B-repeat-containing protein, partial [Treponema sp.]|nr:InlB B-repeat-containing protein [Treponema sp.]
EHEWIFASSRVTQNTTLYAKWDGQSATKYTVTFNSNGGSEVAQIPNITPNTLITAPAAPTKTDLFFGGWYKDNTTFANAWNFASDKVTQNTILYAKWEKLLDKGIELGIPLEGPYSRWFYAAEGDTDETYSIGVEGVSVEDITSAKYLVLKLEAEITSTSDFYLRWAGSTADNGYWNYNGQQVKIDSGDYPVGVKWDSDENLLWIELSILPDYEIFVTLDERVRLAFQTGQIGNTVIENGWLVPDLD